MNHLVRSIRLSEKTLHGLSEETHSHVCHYQFYQQGAKSLQPGSGPERLLNCFHWVKTLCLALAGPLPLSETGPLALKHVATPEPAPWLHLAGELPDECKQCLVKKDLTLEQIVDESGSLGFR